MLVHVKVPRTRVEITGDDPARIVAALREHFDVESEEDDELISAEDSDWFREMAPTMTPGKSLRIYRTNAHLSLAALAEKTGIPKGHLSEMEHDKRPLGLRIAKKLAPALNCDFRSLV